jgi:putative hemolysin
MELLGDLAPYLALIAWLLACSAFFSGTEVAMFSMRRADREMLDRSERRADRLILRLQSRPRQLIATLLIGNEVVNVSMSVVMASMAPFVFPDSGDTALMLYSTFAVLPLLLLFGEITPKTVAIKTSVGWSRRAVRLVWFWSIITMPIRIVIRFVADLLLSVLGVSAAKRQQKDMSEIEFRTLVDAGNAEGELDARERRLIHRVFEFSDKTVGQVMEPRERIFALSYALSMPRLIKEIAERGYSRVPIYQKSLDNIRGILYAKDLVVQGTGLTAPRPLGDLLHEPLFVPQTVPIERLFSIFKQRKIHMALVVNEYGKLIGLVTMEDILEELFGEIHDEREQQKASPRRVIRLRTEPGRFKRRAPAATPPSRSASGDTKEEGS